MKRYPMQPLEFDSQKIIRFKANKIVRALLDFGQARGFGMNEIAERDFSHEDAMQFAQLIGYSVSGYGDLSYASKESVAEADLQAEKMLASGEPADDKTSAERLASEALDLMNENGEWPSPLYEDGPSAYRAAAMQEATKMLAEAVLALARAISDR